MNRVILPELDRHTRMIWEMLFFLVPRSFGMIVQKFEF